MDRLFLKLKQLFYFDINVNVPALESESQTGEWVYSMRAGEAEARWCERASRVRGVCLSEASVCDNYGSHSGMGP